MSKVGIFNDPFYSDFRGEIHRHDIHGAKFNVLFTKKGIMRSGDFHAMPQFDIILKGTFKLTLRQNDEDIVMTKGPNELIVIPPNIPHLFKALTDTVMIEWWPGPFEAEYYEPYRKLIDKQIEYRQ